MHGQPVPNGEHAMQAAANSTWSVGATRKIPVPKGGKAVHGGSNLTTTVAKTPFAIGYTVHASLCTKPELIMVVTRIWW